MANTNSFDPIPIDLFAPTPIDLKEVHVVPSISPTLIASQLDNGDSLGDFLQLFSTRTTSETGTLLAMGSEDNLRSNMSNDVNEVVYPSIQPHGMGASGITLDFALGREMTVAVHGKAYAGCIPGQFGGFGSSLAYYQYMTMNQNSGKFATHDTRSTQDSSNSIVNDLAAFAERRKLKRNTACLEYQWGRRFAELKNYQSVYGDCNVPHGWKGNPGLAQWVKRVRGQAKLLKSGASSTLTLNRLKALEDLGFVFFPRKEAWSNRFNELKRYYEENGHCNILSSTIISTQLGYWIKAQRRQYRQKIRGEQSPMTDERVRKLESIGFSWNVRVPSPEEDE